jgi:hypothetical protein
MATTDRAHLDQLSIDEFDAVVFPKDSGFAHTVILVHRKELLCDVDFHSVRRSFPKE